MSILSGVAISEELWSTWAKFDDFTEGLSAIVTSPSKKILKSSVQLFERFIVLLYDRASCLKISVDETQKHLFACNGRSIGKIPPSHGALCEHLKRALYQGCFSWGQS